MSTAPSFELAASGRRVDVRWSGFWTAPVVAHYEDALRNQLRLTPAVDHLVVNADGVKDCDFVARGKLADLHAHFKDRFNRSVFVANSPRIRGVCLWIARVSEDENALVCAKDTEIESWLAGGQGRLERAMQRLSAHLEKIGRGPA